MADEIIARQREVNTVFADSGVSDLDTLQAKRAKLVKRNAKVWARYGDGGTFTQKRDNLYAAIAVEKRQQLEAEGKKITEPMVDAAVRTDARYVACIDDAETERAKLYVRSNGIKDLDEKMFRDNAVIRYLTSEPKV